MITEEQIKNLKPGDIIYLNNYPLTFQTSNIHGHVFAHDNVAECGEGCACWFSNKYLSLTSAETAPKYDPCREFKKGDIVRYVPHNGRECPAMPLDEYYRVKTLTVVEDEDSNHNVLVETQDGRNKYIRFCFLQLVTPVEELEPFRVRKYSSFYAVEKYNNHKARPATYDVDFHPHAKEAAEAECARLNAEYRKEQSND